MKSEVRIADTIGGKKMNKEHREQRTEYNCK